MTATWISYPNLLCRHSHKRCLFSAPAYVRNLCADWKFSHAVLLPLFAVYSDSLTLSAFWKVCAVPSPAFSPPSGSTTDRQAHCHCCPCKARASRSLSQETSAALFPVLGFRTQKEYSHNTFRLGLDLR